MQVICEPHAPTRRPVAPFRQPVFFFRGGTTVWPPLKGEVPATQAVGFQTKTLRASIYAPQGRVRMRGSRWVQAQPAGSKCVQAQPAGSADQRFPQGFWKSADPEGFNLWPSGSSPEPAAATGCRPCRPAAGGCRQRRPAAGGCRQRRLVIRRETCGFAEFGKSSLCFPNSSIEPAAASALQAQPGRQCRSEFSGEVRKTEDPSRLNVWRLGSCSIWRQQVAVGPADPAGSYRLYTDRSEGLTACGGEGILYA